MYLDFDELRPDTPRIDRPISVREGVLLSIIAHLLGVIAVITLSRAAAEARAEALRLLEEAAAVELAQAPERDPETFVFVQPRLDQPAPRPPERAELSDIDRQAQAPERAPDPQNPLPFALGNSAERIEAPEPLEPEELLARAAPAPEPVPPGEAPVVDADPAPPGLGETEARPGPADTGEGAEAIAFAPLRSGRAGRAPSAERARREAAGESLGTALQNLQQYIDRESFNNPTGGGGRWGPSIQFDTKGVEFGPWIRRFVAQIRRNWVLPQIAFWASGHVVVTFNVHKDGRLTDLAVAGPSSIDGFNNSSFNALAASNPTYPLPPEYPDDRAFFTVTFYYNETPP